MLRQRFPLFLKRSSSGLHKPEYHNKPNYGLVGNVTQKLVCSYKAGVKFKRSQPKEQSGSGPAGAVLIKCRGFFLKWTNYHIKYSLTFCLSRHKKKKTD